MALTEKILGIIAALFGMVAAAIWLYREINAEGAVQKDPAIERASPIDFIDLESSYAGVSQVFAAYKFEFSSGLPAHIDVKGLKCLDPSCMGADKLRQIEVDLFDLASRECFRDMPLDLFEECMGEYRVANGAAPAEGVVARLAPVRLNQKEYFLIYFYASNDEYVVPYHKTWVEAGFQDYDFATNELIVPFEKIDGGRANIISSFGLTGGEGDVLKEGGRFEVDLSLCAPMTITTDYTLLDPNKGHSDFSSDIYVDVSFSASSGQKYSFPIRVEIPASSCKDFSVPFQLPSSLFQADSATIDVRAETIDRQFASQISDRISKNIVLEPLSD